MRLAVTSRNSSLEIFVDTEIDNKASKRRVYQASRSAVTSMEATFRIFIFIRSSTEIKSRGTNPIGVTQSSSETPAQRHF